MFGSFPTYQGLLVDAEYSNLFRIYYRREFVNHRLEKRSRVESNPTLSRRKKSYALNLFLFISFFKIFSIFLRRNSVDVEHFHVMHLFFFRQRKRKNWKLNTGTTVEERSGCITQSRWLRATLERWRRRIDFLHPCRFTHPTILVIHRIKDKIN